MRRVVRLGWKGAYDGKGKLSNKKILNNIKKNKKLFALSLELVFNYKKLFNELKINF